jgi:hypothetical protein
MGDVDPTEMINFETGHIPFKHASLDWPIGITALGLGQGTPKGGEIGTVGYLPRTEVSGKNIKSVNASPCLCPICPGMNLF